MENLWFVAWECLCTDVNGSPEALDARCPGHDLPAETGCPVRVTPGVSTNLGHICASKKCVNEGVTLAL
jgi:hypothetical protein